MSIEMDNPKTPIEKIDAAANLVSQMLLANTMRDSRHLKECHDKAAKLLHDVMQQLADDKKADSVPKSASEVAEQFRKSCGNIDEFGDTDFVCSVEEVAALISSDRRERERGWIDANGYDPAEKLPEVGKYVIVRGGVAYHNGHDWYTVTGFEFPGRKIQWHVDRWWPLPGPADAGQEGK